MQNTVVCICKIDFRTFAKDLLFEDALVIEKTLSRRDCATEICARTRLAVVFSGKIFSLREINFNTPIATFLSQLLVFSSV